MAIYASSLSSSGLRSGMSENRQVENRISTIRQCFFTHILYFTKCDSTATTSYLDATYKVTKIISNTAKPDLLRTFHFVDHM